MPELPEQKRVVEVKPPAVRKVNYAELHCITNAGQVSVVHAGDLVRNTVPEILARARARGVVVESQVR